MPNESSSAVARKQLDRAPPGARSFCVQIVRANTSHAPALSAIAWAAKARWGYRVHWLEKWRALLTITPDFIARNETSVALLNRQPVAFHALVEGPEATNLEHLWVLPEWIGQGIGRALFQHAIEYAAGRGTTRLTIEADPHAEPFYLHMGARRVSAVSSEIDGQRRELPLLVYELQPEFNGLVRPR